jgi:hypothetical protein
MRVQTISRSFWDEDPRFLDAFTAAEPRPYPLFVFSGGKGVLETRILIPEAAWDHLNPYGTTVDISVGGYGNYDWCLAPVAPC